MFSSFKNLVLFDISKTLLSSYYKSIKKTFEAPNSFYGGDKANVDWVIEDKIFYQIYAPSNNKSLVSFTKDLQTKFSNDLDKLLGLIYNHNYWNKTLNEFIFIVNTTIFENIKNYIVNLYHQLSQQYSGVSLYEVLVLAIADLHKHKEDYINVAKYLIVYVFDRCDIFVKEKQ